MTSKIVNRLIMIVITAVVMLLTLVEWNLTPVRVLFALVLVTILPGYALTSAIFVNNPLGIQEKIAFSFGFSLGLTSLGGLLLNYTRWGLQLTSWVILLGGISLVASWFALVRMKVDIKGDSRVVNVPLQIRQIVLMVLAFLVLSGTYLSARAGAESLQVRPTTLLWARWTDDTHTEILLGLRNHEYLPEHYRLEITTLSGEVQEWSDIYLTAGEVWEVGYVPPASVAENDMIRVTLYRLDSPNQRYREVFLRWSVTE